MAILPFPVLWHRLWYLILLCSAPKSGNITKSQKHISLDFNSVCPRIWLLDAMLEQNINFSVLFFTTLVLSFNWFLVHTSWIRSYWYPNYRVSDGKNWYLHLIYLIWTMIRFDERVCKSLNLFSTLSLAMHFNWFV